jgi:hypothetical protein
MRKVLIFDEDYPLREALIETLRRTANVEVVVASDLMDLVAKIREDFFASVLVDTLIVGHELPRVLAAVGLATVRPLLLLVTNDRQQDLDPDLISLVVRRPYDVAMVTGILLAAVMEMPHGKPGDADVTIRRR